MLTWINLALLCVSLVMFSVFIREMLKYLAISRNNKKSHPRKFIIQTKFGWTISGTGTYDHLNSDGDILIKLDKAVDLLIPKESIVFVGEEKKM